MCILSNRLITLKLSAARTDSGNELKRECTFAKNSLVLSRGIKNTV